VGVASRDPSENECQIKRDSLLGMQESGWVYGSNGTTCHAQHKNGKLTTYKAGAVITLTLDLTKRGCLSASFDQHKAEFVLFESTC
jgi:hypothetical protein